VIQIFDWLRENVNTFPGVFFYHVEFILKE